MTKREMFETIATINSDNTEIVEFCNRQIELLNARKTSNGGMTATQKANVAVKETIKAVLADAVAPVTITEMLVDSRLAGYTNQKISALITQLAKDGVVVKAKEGKKTVVSLA